MAHVGRPGLRSCGGGGNAALLPRAARRGVQSSSEHAARGLSAAVGVVEAEEAAALGVEKAVLGAEVLTGDATSRLLRAP
mmetsp:Transcript_15504/g.54340  ORF Transcript_15504/g.54340 Transcript_15504/m.54340 type:complete len:80 (-) Transcript_15504:1228-1467(-)